MNRKAIIIANQGVEGTEGYLSGVLKDVDHYTSFLLSPNGGYWHQGEIAKMIRPSVGTVQSAIKQLSIYDYALIVFSGHGYYSRQRSSTVLELRDGEDIDSAELRSGAPKQTLIVDCCRKKSPAMLMEARDMRFAKAGPQINPDDCRKYYDRRIEECPGGLVVMYACSIDEVAGDDPQKGGYYSYSLLETSHEWARNSTVDTSKSVGYFSVVEAHDATVPPVRRLSGGRQNPSIEKPRTTPYYPLCIVA